jgi:hypothetical protein
MGREIHKDVFWKILKEGGYFEDIDIDETVTLEGIDQLKIGLEGRAGIIWLCVGTRDWLL